MTSRDAADYATGPQLAHALDELAAWRKTLGTRIRATEPGRDRFRLEDQRTYLSRLIRDLRQGVLPPTYVLNHAEPEPIENATAWHGIADRYRRAVEQARR